MNKYVLYFSFTISILVSSDSVNSFAFDLYGEVAERDSISFVVSPSSIYSALFMACLGADGATEDEILSALSIDEVNDLSDDFFVSNLSSTLTANSVWIQKDFSLKAAFLGSLASYFDNEIMHANFSNNPNQSRLQINRWVGQHTNNNILNLLKENDISKRTRLVLVNALYMLSKWKKAFDKSKTIDKDFYLKHKSMKLPTMQMKDKMKYFEDGHIKSVSIGLEDSLIYTVILPNQDTMMSYVEKNLDNNYFALIRQRSKSHDVALSLPRMTLHYSVSLKDHLFSMGVKQAFLDGKANFSRMRDENDLAISNVVHQSTIDLDEVGVEASAATAVIIRVKTTSIKKSKIFNANRPFIFIISDGRNNRIHFIGKFRG